MSEEPLPPKVFSLRLELRMQQFRKQVHHQGAVLRLCCCLFSPPLSFVPPPQLFSLSIFSSLLVLGPWKHGAVPVHYNKKQNSRSVWVSCSFSFVVTFLYLCLWACHEEATFLYLCLWACHEEATCLCLWTCRACTCQQTVAGLDQQVQTQSQDNHDMSCLRGESAELTRIKDLRSNLCTIPLDNNSVLNAIIWHTSIEDN